MLQDWLTSPVQWQDKPWGKTAPLYRGPEMHADRIHAVAGGYCSIHLHAAKVNVFHVLRGRLYVRHFTPSGDRLGGGHICEGQSHIVPASVWHQFWAVGDPVEAIEVYLPAAGVAAIEHEDIERHNGLAVGGIEQTYHGMGTLWARAFLRPEPVAIAPEQPELFANV